MGRSASANPAVETPLGRTARRRGADRRRARALGARIAATAGIAAVASALILSDAIGSAKPSRLLLWGVIVGVPVIAGVYARRAPRTRRFGTVLVAVGLVWALTLMGESPHSVPYSVGRLVGWLTVPLFVYLMLASAGGRLAPGRDRALFGAILTVVVLLYIGSAMFVEAYPPHTPWASCDPDCPPNALLILGDEPAVMASVVQPVRELIAILLLAGLTLSLAHRMGTATPLRRRTMAPVVGMGLVFTVILTAFIVTRRAAPDSAALETMGVLWSLSIPGLAAAFLVGLVERRLFVADALGRLSATLGGELDAPQLRRALAAALGDETLEVRLWDRARDAWGPGDGPGTASPTAAGRATMEIDDAGAPVALIAFDDALCGDDELLEAVGTHARAALRHARITRDLERSLAELDRSRSRIATAATQERARIERDLHDGAQQRLVALRIKLSIAEELMRADPAAGQRKFHELGPDIERALDEVRSLAHGIYPAVLADRGVEDALSGALMGSPLPVHISARGVGRHPAAIESAVYFTCLEAVQNAVKHARGATGVWISLHENAALTFEVRDDGAGFVPPAAGTTTGLRNMADRLEAVGGRLRIDSAPGRGARIAGTVGLGRA
ncbi:MAG TPA: histidine kinase [Solirubrobacteraceae bacterium]|nr:histidine kinase [Solirubrobacteraceae bacterium]